MAANGATDANGRRLRHRERLPLAVMMAAILIQACSSSSSGTTVHRATVLEFRIPVQVDSLHVAPRNMQDVPVQHDRTIVQMTIRMTNPSDARLWANDCDARAYDRDGHRLYGFTFNPDGGVAGAYMEPGGSFQGEEVIAVVPTTRKSVETTASIRADCGAWDWGDTPPI
jgi:hypothetical protein